MAKGRAVNNAICAACSAKMPKSRLRSWRSRRTSPMREGCACVSSCSLDTSGSGVIQATTPMLMTVRIPVSINNPGTPIMSAIIGATTRLTEKVKPMLKPIIAIARVRTPSRVKSASSAVTAALTAPAPWMARAATSMGNELAAAARKLPAAKTISPT